MDMGGAEPTQPFTAADPAVAVLIRLDELLAQPVGAGQGGSKLLLTEILRALAQEVEPVLRAAWGCQGSICSVGGAVARQG
jgi:hypothetical protein